jgi:hypothetical protein
VADIENTTRRSFLPTIPPTKLFHITTCEAVESILAHGLRANEDGQIFAIVDESVADDVARAQIGLSTYALFRIDGKGVSGAIEGDSVAELVAHLQRIIVQPLIRPEFLTLLDANKKIPPGFTAFQRTQFAKWGLTKEQIAEMERIPGPRNP